MAIVETTISQKRIDTFNKEVEIGWQSMEDGNILNGQSVISEFRKKYEK